MRIVRSFLSFVIPATVVPAVVLVATPATLAGGSSSWYPVQSAAFATRVLDQATLPPGSVPATVAVSPQVTFAADAIQPHGAPGETYDADRLYTTPAAPASVVTYVEHHLPKGWWVGITFPPSGPPPPGDTIVQVQVPVAGPHEQTATVSYTVVPDGTGTELRIDALVVWQPSRTGSLVAPRAGSILVTGYTTSNLMGLPQKATKVRVTGRRAESIRQAFDRLPLTSPPDCMENSTAFALTFVAPGSKRPTLRAVQSRCPSPGVVDADRPGQQAAGISLAASCRLTRAVAAALPAGKAPVTREAAAHCRVRAG